MACNLQMIMVPLHLSVGLTCMCCDFQDPADKRNIIADAKLKELTGEERFSGFGFMKLMSHHLIKD